MTKACIRAAFCGAFLSVAAPASATRWEQVDRFNWVDMDSVSRAAGGLVSYRAYHGSDAPAAAEAGRPWGVHCTDLRWYWMENGQLVPVPDEPDLEPYVYESDPLFLKLCR